MNEFDEIAAFYDIMYSDRRADVTMYLDLATTIGGPILECGCGTGRVLFPVAEKGIEIWGIDSSEKMLDIARSKLHKLPLDLRENVRLSWQNMLDFKLDETFKLCIIPFRAFLHLLTPEDQNKALKRIHRSLESGGYLVIDIFAPSHEMLAKETTTIRSDEKVNSRTGQRFNLTDKVSYDHTHQLLHVERHYEHLNGTDVVCHKIMPFTLRYVFRYEMQALLEKNGYQIKEVFGQFDKRPYDYKSGEMIFVAQKHG
ncbi:MAG: class I SAM-dependent methyltransferase [Desulfobacterales bacterium]